MKSLMGLINISNEQNDFAGLSDYRNQASIPFAGRYRLIDFTLSNMVSANISEVGVFIESKFRSLMDHLGDGRFWNLDRRRGGLFIFPPEEIVTGEGGDLHFFHENRDYFERSEADYVLVSGSQFIANVNVTEAFEQHVASGADVTLITTDAGHSEEAIYCARIATDEAGRVSEIGPDLNERYLLTSMYIINKSLLLSLIDECGYDRSKKFFTDCILKDIDRLQVRTYEHTGYYAYMDSLVSYYKHSMDLLNETAYRSLFYDGHVIRTKVISQPPINFQRQANVTKSIIANGTLVHGEVDHSIVFRGVEINKGATIKNSIIMQRSRIEEGAYLENVILDKEVHIRANERLIGTKNNPYYVTKRAVI